MDIQYRFFRYTLECSRRIRIQSCPLIDNGTFEAIIEPLLDVENGNCKLNKLEPTQIGISEGKNGTSLSAKGTSRFVVAFYSNYVWTADSEEASKMPIMTMARHGRRVSLPSRCLRVVKGFDEGYYWRLSKSEVDETVRGADHENICPGRLFQER
jgi:hypothetical protein